MDETMAAINDGLTIDEEFRRWMFMMDLLVLTMQIETEAEREQ